MKHPEIERIEALQREVGYADNVESGLVPIEDEAKILEILQRGTAVRHELTAARLAYHHRRERLEAEARARAAREDRVAHLRSRLAVAEEILETARNEESRTFAAADVAALRRELERIEGETAS